MAFDRLDKDGSGVVTIDDVRSAYNTTKHPDVLSGKKTPDEVLTEFMSQWDTGTRDGTITKDEFLDYYKGMRCFPFAPCAACMLMLMSVLACLLPQMCPPV